MICKNLIYCALFPKLAHSCYVQPASPAAEMVDGRGDVEEKLCSAVEVLLSSWTLLFTRPRSFVPPLIP